MDQRLGILPHHGIECGQKTKEREKAKLKSVHSYHRQRVPDQRVFWGRDPTLATTKLDAIEPLARALNFRLHSVTLLLDRTGTFAYGIDSNRLPTTALIERKPHGLHLR